MRFLVIIFAFAWASVCSSPANKIKSRNIVVPAGRAEGRVTHGSSARPGQFPYQAALNTHYADGTAINCGGTLISHTEVITAAHCTVNATKIEVLLGSTNRDAATDIYEVPITDVIIHPGWNLAAKENDISIIHIPYTDYSANIQPAKLPAKENAYATFDGEIAVASGWGRMYNNVPGPVTNLQYAYFEVIPNSVCGQIFRMKSSKVCVATSKGVSTCKGDSGGPLILEGSKTLIGISSYVSNKGCEANTPAVFTRVTSFLDWIGENVKFL